MARRKQRHLIEPKTLLGLLVAIGVLAVIAQAVQNMPSGTGDTFGMVIVLAVAALVTYPIVRFVRRANAKQAALRRAIEISDRHMEPLLRRRAQLVRLDPYGKPQADKWAKEIDYFIEQHIQPSLDSRQTAALARNYRQVVSAIGQKVEAATRTQAAFQTFSDDMTPAEFETFCAEELRRAGWDARVTMQSRDQGVDVIAAKNGCRVIVQCKLYARPIGNKAVQEATAARAHEQANFGIVVSNNRYTDAAEQLAATNGVLLLHYRDLQNLASILDRHR